MTIEIREVKIQFRNPVTGQPTRSVEAHYYGRSIRASIDGVEQLFRFTPAEIPFITIEEEMILAIQTKLNETATNETEE